MNKALKCKNGDILSKFRISIPIGELEISCCSIGIHSLHTTKSSTFPDPKDSEFKPIKLTFQENPDLRYKSIQECLNYFECFFTPITYKHSVDDVFSQTPKICWSGICTTPNTFTEKVLKTLLTQIKPGSKVSYSDLASLAGNAKAQRAVGSVMRKNPIALIVPCHRVIKSNKSIGNYNGGVEIKEWLLDYESRYFIA